MDKAKRLLNAARSGEPISKIRDTATAEDFSPATLDKESDKAARIVRSFFIDGYIVPYKTLNRIGNEVLRHAKGLAVFTVLRTGLHHEGTAGSGIVVVKREDGHWSPPSGILIDTDGWDFPEGGDVYDCVCVLNDDQAAQALTQTRCTFGDDVTYGPGPLGGSMNDSEVKQPWAPVWVYVKSKGHAIDAQVKGNAIVERKDENERFYGVDGLSARQILAGEVKAPSGPASQLQEVLKAVEEQKHDSSSLPPSGKSPGDYVVKAPKDAGLAQ